VAEQPEYGPPEFEGQRRYTLVTCTEESGMEIEATIVQTSDTHHNHDPPLRKDTNSGVKTWTPTTSLPPLLVQADEVLREFLKEFERVFDEWQPDETIFSGQ
jgi:hypothetical protein